MSQYLAGILFCFSSLNGLLHWVVWLIQMTFVSWTLVFAMMQLFIFWVACIENCGLPLAKPLKSTVVHFCGPPVHQWGYFLPDLFPSWQILWDGWELHFSKWRIAFGFSFCTSVFAPTGMSTGPTGVLEHTSRDLAWMGTINPWLSLPR